MQNAKKALEILKRWLSRDDRSLAVIVLIFRNLQDYFYYSSFILNVSV